MVRDSQRMNLVLLCVLTRPYRELLRLYDEQQRKTMTLGVDYAPAYAQQVTRDTCSDSAVRGRPRISDNAADRR